MSGLTKQSNQTGSHLSNQGSQEGSLGLVACVTMIAGGMIGSAIFSLSGMTMFYAGPAALVSWIIAAVILLMYGLQVAELSTIFPKSGGVFVFPSKALGNNETQGKIWGWFSVWGYITSNIAGIGFSAIYVAVYLGVGFPAFSGLQVPMAVGSVVLCSFLCFYRISVAGKANTALVAVLVATMLIFVGVGLFGGAWDASMLTPFFTQGAKGGTGFISAIPNAMVAYGSIVAVAFMVSEVKNPNKNVPKSIAIAMSIVVFLYSLIIITTVGLVSAQFLIDNPGMRFIPLYAAAFTKLGMYPWLTKIISISAVMALLTTILVLIAITSRAIAATAEGGLLPKVLSKSHEKTGAPLNATIVVAAFSGLISVFPQFTAEIVNLGSLFAAITIMINCFSLLAARRKFEYVEGNYRAPGGSIVPILTLAVIVATYIPRILEGSKILYFTIGWYAFAAVILAFTLNRNKAVQ
jgi:amino acid transporter